MTTSTTGRDPCDKAFALKQAEHAQNKRLNSQTKQQGKLTTGIYLKQLISNEH
jgi:hypothetical protein